MESGASTQPLPPQAIAMQIAMGGFLARALNTAVRLDVPDLLQSSGPLTAAEMVANGVKADPVSLERVLRACASACIFTEDRDRRFGLTPISEVLTSDAPGSVKMIAREVCGRWLDVFQFLPEATKTGNPQAREVLGMEWWDFLKANPEEMAVFGEAMKSNSLMSMRGVLELCDFSSSHEIVDVGGGYGHLVIALLLKYPHLKGVLMDVPDLIPIAKANNPVSDPALAARLEYVGGDMFASVFKADTYILKHIIHDWTDELCIRLMRNCRESMEGNGRMICVDAVLPPFGDTGAMDAKLIDLLMMIGIKGKERTREQWEDLCSASSFRISSILPIPNSSTSIVEARPV